MLNRGTAVAILALAVAACSGSDATGTHGGLLVSLRLDATPVPVISDTPNGPRIQCNFNLTATATGQGSAQWQDAKTLWFAGRNRATPVDSTTNTAGEVQTAFGGAQINAGETQHAQWFLYARVP